MMYKGDNRVEFEPRKFQDFIQGEELFTLNLLAESPAARPPEEVLGNTQTLAVTDKRIKDLKMDFKKV